MLQSIPGYILYLVAATAAAIISAYAVGKILLITRSRKIYDLPDHTRKIHGAGIPSLGGIGIFIGYILVAMFFWPGGALSARFVIPSTMLLFFTGIYDDLMNMRPYKKLVAQLLASALTIHFAHIRITSFNGLFGIGDLPPAVSLCVTTLACTLFINAFNFVDGIDGLAGVTAILYSCTLGILFACMHLHGVAWVCFSLAGATLGLLFYNFAPARIYMGDTGSMLLGFTLFILTVLFVNTCDAQPAHLPWVHSPAAATIIAFSLLFLPLYDAIRVFILRASRGISPLRADRTHLHYYLLDAGCSHSQSVLIITIINAAIIATAFLAQDANPAITLLLLLAIASLSLLAIYLLRQRNLKSAVSPTQNA